MREVFGPHDEPSYELEIYDSLPYPEDAEMVIMLFRGHVIDGMNPDKAKEMAIIDAGVAISSESLEDQASERPSN
jgi:hypothetical protein